MNSVLDKNNEKYIVLNHTKLEQKNGEGDNFNLYRFGYGKNNVKVLYVKRDGHLHIVRECEVDVRLRLSNKDDYMSGDNSHIIATDSQKNTVYVLAKKYGVSSPERFALLLCQHFIMMYNHIEEAKINIEDYPWKRLQAMNHPHNHAFIMVPNITRYATVELKRNGIPHVISGLKNLHVIKTTQSAFKGFINDEFRTLPDASDRIFSTKVTASWQYNTSNQVDYDKIWNIVKECILEKFAGPPNEGIYSPSVQNTLYLTEKLILNKVEQISSIEMSMPNKHYFPFDFSKFPKELVGEGENNTVFVPIDKPFGFIHAALARVPKSRV